MHVHWFSATSPASPSDSPLTARIITSGGSAKVAHVRSRPRVAVCQVEGARWLTLEGAAVVKDDDGVRLGASREERIKELNQKLMAAGKK